MAGTAHLVCFRIGKETFGVEIFAVREIVKAQEASRILVVDLDGFTVGFLVDAATEVLKLPDESIDSAPEELKNTIHDDYLEGVGKLDDRLVIILNLRHLLTDGDAEALETALGVGPSEG